MCLFIFAVHTWNQIKQPEFIVLTLNAIEKCADLSAMHSTTQELDCLVVKYL